MSAAGVFMLISTASISAQTGQSRGFQQTSNQNRVSMSDGDRQAQEEIEMMRDMIRQRREQQEQQRALLQELQQAVDAADPSSSQSHQSQQQNWHQEGPVSQRQRVTSGSTLSMIEAEERADIDMLEQKFNMEMQVAQREIDLLKKQLEIANRQLNQCQAGTVTYNTASNAFNNMPAQSRTSRARQQSQQAQRQQTVSQKAKAPKKQTVKQQAQPQPKQESATDQAARAEIEMMQKMLQERRAQQEQQMKLIRDLQQAVGGVQ